MGSEACHLCSASQPSPVTSTSPEDFGYCHPPLTQEGRAQRRGTLEHGTCDSIHLSEVGSWGNVEVWEQFTKKRLPNQVQRT